MPRSCSAKTPSAKKHNLSANHSHPKKPMSNEPNKNQQLFWGCFIALVTTSFAFITRAFLVNDPSLWPADLGLDTVKAQELFGAGIWPFAISIILFSLVIDRVGYRAAMIFSFVCYAIYAVLALQAHAVLHPAGAPLEGEALSAARASAWNMLYAGSIVLGLGNGTSRPSSIPLSRHSSIETKQSGSTSFTQDGQPDLLEVV